MVHVAIVLVGLVLLMVVLVIVMRLRHAMYMSALRSAISAYAASRGGSVTFDDQDGMTVKGPLGEGRARLTVLTIMCKPGERESWNTSIGFVLREYMPDAFADAFAKAAREDLAKAEPAILALSDDDLRGRLRVMVCSKRSPAEGLATCARPIGDRFEARVVLDGFNLRGLPTSTRARLRETDDALHERALELTLGALGDPPHIDAGEAGRHVWLCCPEKIFGVNAVLLGSDGPSLVWTMLYPGTPESELARIAGRSLTTGPMKGALFAWDGEKLHDVGVVAHTVKGPTTPDFTLWLPPSIVSELGIETGRDGAVGVNHR